MPLYEERRASIAGVPGFWPGALMGHPELAEYVTERDEEVFEHLVDLSVQQEDDVKSGYRITLAFRPNPLFSNAELVKTLRHHLPTTYPPPARWAARWVRRRRRSCSRRSGSS